MMPNDERPLWQECAAQLDQMALADAGPTATYAERRAAFLRACAQRPALADAYSRRLTTAEFNTSGVRLHEINGVTVEVVSPGAAEKLCAARVNELIRSGHGVLAAMDIAEHEAPSLWQAFARR